MASLIRDPGHIRNQFGRAAQPAVLAVIVVASWLVVQVASYGEFIFHDTWRYNFPRLFSMTKLAGCGELPQWDASVDSGSPVIIETISSALTNVIRVPTLIFIRCLGLDTVPALFVYKAQVLLMYLALAAGMYVLGRLLFQHHLSAVFLLAATLFAGLGLDVLHSDQAVIILFWLPWILACGVLAHRNRASSRAAWYLNGAVLFLCLQAFDQYPHFPLLMAAVSVGLYVVLFPRAAWELIRRHTLRMWPAVVLLAITGAQVLIFSRSIGNYSPSLRASLIVDPSVFGETGFVQPTALLNSFLPLATLAGFESLANNMGVWLNSHGGAPGQRMFIFNLDSLLFFIGFIPTVFVLAFVIRPGLWRVRAWWIGFTALLFAVSLQQSQLYWLLWWVPGFNVFRSYFLYVMFVAFGFLMMSGYGVDAFLSLGQKQRQRLLRVSVGLVGLSVIAAGAAVLKLYNLAPVEPDVSSRMGLSGAADIALVIVGAVLLWWAAGAVNANGWVAGLIGVVLISQIVYTQGVYSLVGMSLDKVLAMYGLDAEDMTRTPAAVASDPSQFRRKECTVFAECYASLRDTVSLRRDQQGTFLRNINEPVFQDGLDLDVMRALDGITHPVFWLSSTVQPAPNTQALVADMNANKDRMLQYLAEVTWVHPTDVARVQMPAATANGHLLSLERGRDVVRLTYQSDSPTYLNAGINFDPAWTATVNGQPVEVVPGNFNSLLVPLPAGGGDVVISYHSRQLDFFRYSRYAFDVLGVLVAIGLALTLRRRSPLAVVADRELSEQPRGITPELAPGV